jgi:hypothetical protein
VTASLLLGIGRSLPGHLLAAGRPASGGRADTGQMLVWLLAAGLVIGLVSAAMVIANRVAHHRRYKSPSALFHGLCRLHGLDAASRRLLKQVVRFHRLPHPARLFIEPKWLDPANLGASFQSQAGQLQELRGRLFSVRAAETAG